MTNLKRNSGSTKPKHGNIKEESPSVTPPLKSSLEDKSTEGLIYLIKEQRRRMEYLSAELDFFKTRVIELEGEQEDTDWDDDDWRRGIQ